MGRLLLAGCRDSGVVVPCSHSAVWHKRVHALIVYSWTDYHGRPWSLFQCEKLHACIPSIRPTQKGSVVVNTAHYTAAICTAVDRGQPTSRRQYAAVSRGSSRCVSEMHQCNILRQAGRQPLRNGTLYFYHQPCGNDMPEKTNKTNYTGAVPGIGMRRKAEQSSQRNRQRKTNLLHAS